MPEANQQPLERISFAANEAIALQGDTPTYFGILREGRVDILVSAQSDELPSLDQVMNEGVQVESLEEEGQLVGEAEALLRRNYATLVARVPTTLECIPLSQGSIDKSILRLPSLGMTIAKSLAARLRKRNEQLKERGGVLTEMRRAVDEYSLRFYRLCENLMRQHGLLRPVTEACRKALGSSTFQRGQKLQRQQQRSLESLGTLATARRGRLLSIQAGANLYEEGDDAKELYIVARGLFEVLVEGRVIEYVRPGEAVGEMALLLGEGTRRTATVRAHAFSQVAAIPGDKLGVLVRSHPALILHIAKVLARRIANADTMIGQYRKLVADALDQLYSEGSSCGEDYRRLLSGLEAARDELSAECEELSSACEGILKDYDAFSQTALETVGEAERRAADRTAGDEKEDYEAAVRELEAVFESLSSSPADAQENLRGLSLRLVLRGQPTWTHTMLSPHTGSLAAHCLNTAVISLGIARGMGMKTRELETVAAGGLIHDVGMLGAGDVASQEDELVLHVSTYAEENLAALPDLPEMVRQIVNQHHECWDGSGYPNGLKGEEIALPARLVAVANDLDIMLMKGAELGDASRALEEQGRRYWPEAHKVLLDAVGHALGAKK